MVKCTECGKPINQETGIELYLRPVCIDCYNNHVGSVSYELGRALDALRPKGEQA